MKKGVSPLIAFVLLIGFGVALGALFFQWAKEQASSSLDTTTMKYASEVICGEVSGSANYTTCPFSTVNVRNTGYHRIVALQARTAAGLNQRIPVDIPPSTTIVVNLPQSIQSGETLELIPFITSDTGEPLACGTRIIRTGC